VYVIVLPDATTEGDAVCVKARSGIPTVTFAEAVLLALFESVDVELTVAEVDKTVPEASPALGFTVIVNVAVPALAKALPSVRDDAEKLLRTYIRRNGNYQVDVLLEAAVAASGDAAAGVAALGEALDDVGHQPRGDLAEIAAAKARSAVEIREIQPQMAYLDAIRAGVFCELGEGGVNLTGVIQQLNAAGFNGWAVFEQLLQVGGRRPKVIFLTGIDSSAAAADQTRHINPKTNSPE